MGTIDERLREIIRSEVRAAIRAELAPWLRTLEEQPARPVDGEEFERWLRPSEAAARLRVSAKTLANWRALGAGPPFRRVGRVILYDREQLDLFERP
ncbi:MULTISPECIES: helix-turn-helix domain-containing protein [unclassified Microbacterium]|uniref:helix-turn-helix domain-containing protein n=1 Tax=unclassified Microbacterium TaxID=2609290 RepID=UPI003668E116